MTSRIGQISPANTIKDDNIRQAFSDTESQINKTYELSEKTDASLSDYKIQVANMVDLALKGLTSSSSNADIVTALQNMTKKLKSL